MDFIICKGHENLVELFSRYERVSSVAFKLRYRKDKLKIIKVYNSTSSFNDEDIDEFYRDGQSITSDFGHHSVIMGDFSATVVEKLLGKPWWES